MKTLITLISMAGLLFGDTAEKSFFLGDQRFSIKVSGDKLEKMLGMDPKDPKTINLSVSEVAALADKQIQIFIKDEKFKGLSLERISLVRFHEFDDGKEIWLWEASYICGRYANGPVERISIFITKSGRILIPQPRPYSNSNMKEKR